MQLNTLVRLYDIVAEPAASDVTTPVDALTVATAGSLLVHVPAKAPSVRVMVLPRQMCVEPLMAVIAGVGLTFIVAVATAVPQPLVTP